jgi:luciferase family oxidoreductase group 1
LTGVQSRSDRNTWGLLAASNVRGSSLWDLRPSAETEEFMANHSRLANTPLSILDLAHVRQGGTVPEAFRNSLALAQHAEALGYKRFWLAEHHNIRGVACSATSVLIGFIANGTSKIRVGSGGIMLPNHSPLVIAEQFGTLESLFPGRIDLGLGRAPGGDSAAMRALRGSSLGTGDDFPELVEELRRYLGKASSSQRVHAYPGEATNVPIFLLGSSDFSARLAGALGLPFAFAAHFQPQPLLPALRIYRAAFRPSEVLEKPYAMVGVPILVADSDEQAQFLATTPIQMFLNLIRGVPGPIPPPTKSIEWSADEREMVAAKFGAAIVGGQQRVAARLNEFLEQTLADELIVVSNTYDFKDRLRSYELLAELTKQTDEKTPLATAVRT